jgi:hypothetical protein
LATRASRTNYVFNHLGHFAWAQEAVCRSLLFHGVPKRFPGLSFAFLEGGATWGCQLYADLLSHYEKRNRNVIHNYDPDGIDLQLMQQLFDAYAPASMKELGQYLRPSMRTRTHPGGWDTLDDVDDFLESGLQGPQDIIDIFTRQFYFGCEADDPLNALATSSMLPMGARMNAIFASDIGHWDVPDMRYVLEEAWEAVEDGHIDEEQFRSFTFSNICRLVTAVNPDFFSGTVIEGHWPPPDVATGDVGQAEGGVPTAARH